MKESRKSYFEIGEWEDSNQERKGGIKTEKQNRQTNRKKKVFAYRITKQKTNEKSRINLHARKDDEKPKRKPKQ